MQSGAYQGAATTSSSHHSAAASPPGGRIAAADLKKAEVDSEPVGQHGPRSQFIKDVSEQLIMRVNAEASNIDAAK